MLCKSKNSWCFFVKVQLSQCNYAPVSIVSTWTNFKSTRTWYNSLFTSRVSFIVYGCCTFQWRDGIMGKLLGGLCKTTRVMSPWRDVLLKVIEWLILKSNIKMNHEHNFLLHLLTSRLGHEHIISMVKLQDFCPTTPTPKFPSWFLKFDAKKAKIFRYNKQHLQWWWEQYSNSAKPSWTLKQA